MKINSAYYSEKAVNAATGTIWTVNEQLIADQTYWVVENQNNKIIGWWMEQAITNP